MNIEEYIKTNEVSDIEDLQRMVILMYQGVGRVEMLDRNKRYPVRTSTIRKHHTNINMR